MKLIAREIRYTLEIDGKSTDIAFVGIFAEMFFEMFLSHGTPENLLPTVVKGIVESDFMNLHKETIGNLIVVSYRGNVH